MNYSIVNPTRGILHFIALAIKSIWFSKTLKEFEERLTRANFTRPHQSFMVNLKFIDKYDKSGAIYLKSGKKIPVSSRKKRSLFNCFFFKWDNN